MNRQRIQEGILLILFAGLLMSYYVNEKLPLLVYPGYIPFVLMTAVLAAITGVVAFLTPSSATCCSIQNEGISSVKKRIYTLMLLIPIVAGYLIEPQPLSSATAMQRGISTDIPGLVAKRGVFEFQLEPKERSLIDWVRMLTMNPEPETYIGQEAHVEGFIMNVEGTTMIVRFVVACCSADARPVGLPLAKAHVSSIKNDTWVRIEGVMQEEEIQGERRLVIQPNTVVEIPSPKDPYEFL